MRVRLLGPVDVVVNGVARAVPGQRPKVTLAVLALHAGEVVSVDQLVSAVWNGVPPPTATTTLQSIVSRLRAVLSDRALIVARPRGYLLDVDEEGTDVQAVRRLLRLAADSTDQTERKQQLKAAAGLWRGRSLADLAGLAWFREHRQRLDELRLEVEVRLIDARLAAGEHGDVIVELDELSRRHPHHEQVHAQLMLAQYRAGRQGDALATFQRLRRRLDEDLGIVASQPLRDLEVAMLRQDRSLDRPTAALTPRPATVPAQLPAAVTAFAGRDSALADLHRLISEPVEATSPTGMVVAIISGMAGVGKTTLAVHWAQQVRDRFPDGQLYADLRGFDPVTAPLHPAQVVRAFLDALQVPAERIPTSSDAQVSLYRSLLAGKRMLVLLDNAQDADQVRPLLPGTPECLVLVTSRRQLGALVVTEAATPVPLALPSPEDARELLRRRLGSARIDHDPSSVDAIVALCGRLPLALAIVAAHAATRPSLPLAALAEQLATNALDVLSIDDAAIDLRGVLSWSDRKLSVDAAQLLRLLSLHPPTEVSLTAAASLIGRSRAETAILLGELTQANLLLEPTTGRFALHDLLRAYADERSRADERPEARHAARHRLLDHYLHTGFDAALRLFPHRETIKLAQPTPGALADDVSTAALAMRWFVDHRATLLAILDWSVSSGPEAASWQLAWICTTFLHRRGHVDDQITVQTAAVRAAKHLGDRHAEATALLELAAAYARAHRLDQAYEAYQRVCGLDGRAGDVLLRAHAAMGLSRVTAKQGRSIDSGRHARRAAALYRRAGNRIGAAHALNNLGWTYIALGDSVRAVANCTRALALFEELDDDHGRAVCLDSLGRACRASGDRQQAIAYFERAIDLCRTIGDDANTAATLARLSDAHAAAGNHHAAREAQREAELIAGPLGLPS